MLAAVAGYFAATGDDFAAAMCVVAVLGSLMVSYTRARAEALGVECKVGLATRPGQGGAYFRSAWFSPRAPESGDFELLAPSIYVIAALTIVTVIQRVWHVRNELSSEARRPARAVTSPGRGVCFAISASDLGRTSNSMSESNGANGSNGAAQTDEKVRVAIVGVGNCANSFIQGVQYYKDADPDEEVPGLMHVDLGGYHVSDIEFVAAFDIDSEKVGKDLSEAIWSGQNDTIKFADVPELGVKVERGHDPRRPRQVPEREDHQGAGRNRRRRRDPQGDQGRRPRLLPAGRLRGGDQVVRRAGAEGRRRLRQLPARLHRPRGLLGQALRGGRAADHRRRHQVPGRGDDRPPPARPPLPRPRRAARAHLAAQRRRQHGLLQHARARAARLEEDLEDQRGHLDHGPRAARRQTSTSAPPTTCRG